jgi:hypothetical protein
MEVSNVYEIKLAHQLPLRPRKHSPREGKDMDILYDQEQPPSSNRHHNTCLLLCFPIQSMSGSDR